MSDEFKYDAFLSHSSKDQAVVRAVAERLRADKMEAKVPCGSGQACNNLQFINIGPSSFLAC
jgi:hypothetical protein